MSAVPVVIHGVFMPDARSGHDKPVKGSMIGYMTMAGAPPPPDGPTVPPIPPDGPPPVDPPIDPEPDPGPNVVVVVKPAPVTGGWGLATDKSGAFQWFFVPVAQPKGRP